MIGIIFGSKSDWEVMLEASEILKQFEIRHESKVVSAHRTPEYMYKFAKEAEYEIIIAGAGGSAHLPGMIASLTTIPVIGVPIGTNLLGIDSLLSIGQMPKGIPLATMPINGAINAALYAIQILSINDLELRNKLKKYREEQSKEALRFNV